VRACNADIARYGRWQRRPGSAGRAVETAAFGFLLFRYIVTFFILSHFSTPDIGAWKSAAARTDSAKRGPADNYSLRLPQARRQAVHMATAAPGPKAPSSDCSPSIGAPNSTDGDLSRPANDGSGGMGTGARSQRQRPLTAQPRRPGTSRRRTGSHPKPPPTPGTKTSDSIHSHVRLSK
jgi:hypothetical protein